ncbi:MAG: BatA domain-containing protein [Planctomycetaceae bacterium]|jgi:hypothetical protein|nr:BatA domain-containing protein [Planctomycetaceae bacterium]
MFTFPVFLWFLPLLGAVLLIHLINMFRHRRIEWAAMEFLLAGYRKSRTKILFQQLLLMLLRMLAVAAVILMFAGPQLAGKWADYFGSKASHHIVLLDDSYSMNDRNAAQGGIPVFDDAVGVVKKILEGTTDNSNNRITLILLSRASAVVKGESPEIAELLLNKDGINVVQETLKNLKPSQAANAPEQLLAAAETVAEQTAARYRNTVYFLSDFRRRNWENAAEVVKHIENIKKSGGAVRLIRAANEERSNLGIENASIADGIHAADVDLLVDATLVNYGQDDADNVALSVLIDKQPQPGITVPKIKAGEKTVPPVRFPIRLTGGAEHSLEIELQSDAVPDDNHRFAVFAVPQALEVLIIVPPNVDDRVQYLRTALAPGGAKSGIRTRVEPPAFLISNPLEQYGAVFLFDTPALDTAAVKALEEYVNNGGGVAFFAGQLTKLDFVHSDLYKNGKGLFPVDIDKEETLPPDFLSKTPDVSVAEHPVFRLFGKGESALLGGVKIERYFVSNGETSPAVNTLATLRNGSPLVVEKQFGKGKSVVFLTTADPLWNNWGRGNPSFVVVMLELAAYLAKRPQAQNSFYVGEQVRERESVFPASMTAAGVFEVPTGNEAARLNTLYAVNVDAAEGDIILKDVSELAAALKPVEQNIESAAGFSTAFDFAGQQPLSDTLLILAVLLLLAETLLAGRILPPAKRPKPSLRLR